LLPPRARVCAGFSGGLDSTVLLDLLADAARAGAIELTALHVHHGLSPNADAWTHACEAACARHGVPLSIERVDVRPGGEGIEAAARAARYAAYARRGEEFVALAHHREDQAETVLLQLLRGTGLRGAGGMPELRTLAPGGPRLFRPLLDVPREAIRAYARDHALGWVEDESNAKRDADRNYLRHDVAPLLDARFPGWRGSLGRFARRAAGVHELLEEAARAGRDAPAAHPELQLVSLRHFLRAEGLRMPSEAALADMARQLYGARPGAQVRLVHDGHLIRRYRGMLYVQPVSAPSGAAYRVAWSGEAEVALGEGRGSVRFESATGAGLAAEAHAQGHWFFAPRAGGERLRLRAAGPSRTLKNLLQEHAVPPWQREVLPLLFHEERLVWVPGVGIEADYACPPGRAGLRPCWEVAGNAPLC